MDKAALDYAFWQTDSKIKRAYRHIDEAQQWFTQYLATDFAEIGEELDPETGARTYVVKAQQATIDIPLAIGDAFHCLNAALDYAMSGLMRAKGLSTARISFPTHDTRKDLRKSFMRPKAGKAAPPNRRIVEAFPALACLFLTTIQPYRGGNLKVWEVRKADNIDKHNLILPSITITQLRNISLIDKVHNNRIHAAVAQVTAGGRVNVARVFGSQMEIQNKGEASASITFPDGLEVFAGEPVFPTLTQCAELVTEACVILRDIAKRHI